MKIFEIKIYPFSEEEFENKKQIFIKKYYDEHRDASFARNEYFYNIFYADKLTFENYCIVMLNYMLKKIGYDMK